MANRVPFVRVDRHNLSGARGLFFERTAARPAFVARANEKSLRLPDAQACCELFGKGGGVCRRLECLHDEAARRLVLAVPAHSVMVSDDDIWPELSNLEDHTAERLCLSPEAESLCGRFREAEISQGQKVRLRALNLCRSERLARANHTEFFVKLRAGSVLPALAIGGKERDCVRAPLAPEHRQRRPVFVVRMRRDAHHSPGVREIKQSLIKLNRIRLILSLKRRRILRERLGLCDERRDEDEGQHASHHLHAGQAALQTHLLPQNSTHTSKYTISKEKLVAGFS